LAGTTIKLPIKAIEWRYPEAITVMKVGEWEFDYFEITKQAQTEIDAVNSTTSRDKSN